MVTIYEYKYENCISTFEVSFEAYISETLQASGQTIVNHEDKILNIPPFLFMEQVWSMRQCPKQKGQYRSIHLNKVGPGKGNCALKIQIQLCLLENPQA